MDTQPQAPDQRGIAPPSDETAPRTLSPAQLAIQAEARQRTNALLRDLWQRKLPIVREQLRTLERALATLDAATRTTPLRSDAVMAAHKLSGSLGMFGYHNGTQFARQLEACLESDEPIARPVFAGLLEQLIASLDL